MEAVKRERAHLLAQLTQVKTDPGKAGGDLQNDDIQRLRHELEIKKAKLNELHEVLCNLVHYLIHLFLLVCPIKFQLSHEVRLKESSLAPHVGKLRKL